MVIAYSNNIIENIKLSRELQKSWAAKSYVESNNEIEDSTQEINLEVFHPEETDIDLDDNILSNIRLSSPFREKTLRSSMTKKFT